MQAGERHYRFRARHLLAQRLMLTFGRHAQGALFRTAAIAIIEIAGALEKLEHSQVIITQLERVGDEYPYRIAL